MTWKASVLALFPMLAACAAGGDPLMGIPGGAGPGSTSGSGGASGNGGASSGSTGGTTSGGGGSGAGSLPCDVAGVVRAKCQLCHGATPLFGAPSPIVTYADTQASARTMPSSKVWQTMQQYVHTSDPVTHMPPSSQAQLSSAELATLDAWFAASAPSGSGSCGSSSGSGGGGGSSGGSGGNATGSGGGSTTDTGGGGGSAGAAGGGGGGTQASCTITHTMVAHAPGNPSGKYVVPNPTNDFYICFNFKSPFAANELATGFMPIVDDTRVIHHWILYASTQNLTDGSTTSNCVLPTVSSSDTMIAGWAPGGQPTILDPDVGLSMQYPYFQLQVHYNNQRYADAADASGVGICSTTDPRPNVAGIVTLGNMFFSIPAGAKNYPVTSNCSNLAADGKTPMNVIITTPHMHLLGTGFQTQLTHNGTNMGNLSDVPLGTWNFEDQRHYVQMPRRQVLPGDVLTTTCYYNNPTSNAVGFGVKTTDEMCFDFVAVYPYSVATKKCGSVF